jgi:CobQ-like glutamine amidotransferase family enzyme
VTRFEVVSFLPGLLNINGDAENASVLARRAAWAGADARVTAIGADQSLPSSPDAVVVGSGTDATIGAARAVLLGAHDELRRWATEGVPILAVGTGWELLSWGIEFSDGRNIEGLAVLPGRAVPRETRVTGDLVVRTRYGRLVGYENHARDYIGAEGSPLGRVVRGSGNGGGSGQEGVVMGSVFGTHLHGPVLAKNPALADHLLGIAFERRDEQYRPGAETSRVDGYAEQARKRTLAGLGISGDEHR